MIIVSMLLGCGIFPLFDSGSEHDSGHSNPFSNSLINSGIWGFTTIETKGGCSADLSERVGAALSPDFFYIEPSTGLLYFDSDQDTLFSYTPTGGLFSEHQFSDGVSQGHVEEISSLPCSNGSTSDQTTVIDVEFRAEIVDINTLNFISIYQADYPDEDCNGNTLLLDCKYEASFIVDKQGELPF